MPANHSRPRRRRRGVRAKGTRQTRENRLSWPESYRQRSCYVYGLCAIPPTAWFFATYASTISRASPSSSRGGRCRLSRAHRARGKARWRSTRSMPRGSDGMWKVFRLTPGNFSIGWKSQTLISSKDYRRRLRLSSAVPGLIRAPRLPPRPRFTITCEYCFQP